MEFQERLVLVTGAARGIGAATARALAAHGASLVLVDRDADALHATAESLDSGHRVHPLVVDLSDTHALADMLDGLEARLGPIDHLAHVAGIFRPGDALSTRLEDWDACMSVNARALFVLTREVGTRMAARGRGSIVAVGSNAAATPRSGMAAYAASKAAATHYLRCLALELAPRGVRCNIVSPGSTDTDMQRAFACDDASRRAVLDGAPQRWRLGIPLGRIARPEDVAEAIVFLLSDRSRHIVLHDLRVDGGATLDA